METVIGEEIFTAQMASARRPMHGLTVLLVEDSKYCSEAIRLMCLKSGARLRRADSKRSAYRHLATYQPSLVIVDVGLPDGNGLDLVGDLAKRDRNAAVILVTSGLDSTAIRTAAKANGADGFLAKPLTNIRTFQEFVLSHFPDRLALVQKNVVPIKATVVPDTLAMTEDLRHTSALLANAIEVGDTGQIEYCAQFLTSVADSAKHDALVSLARTLTHLIDTTHVDYLALGKLSDDVHRLMRSMPVI